MFVYVFVIIFVQIVRKWEFLPILGCRASGILATSAGATELRGTLKILRNYCICICVVFVFIFVTLATRVPELRRRRWNFKKMTKNYCICIFSSYCMYLLYSLFLLRGLRCYCNIVRKILQNDYKTRQMKKRNMNSTLWPQAWSNIATESERACSKMLGEYHVHWMT